MRLLAIFALCFLLLPAPAFAQDTPQLKVDITPLKPTAKNMQDFEVHTKLTNTSQSELKMLVWLCSYPDHWKSDNPHVGVPGVPCDKNFLKWETLKAGAAYERDLTLHVEMPVRDMPESVTFRLSFQAGMEDKAKVTPPVFWSEPMTVKLE